MLTFWISSFAGVLEDALSIYPTLTAAGGLQHFFEFCSTMCWQKGVSDRSIHPTSALKTLAKKLYVIDTPYNELHVSDAWLWQKGVSATYILFLYFFAEWVLVSNMAKRCILQITPLGHWIELLNRRQKDVSATYTLFLSCYSTDSNDSKF